MKSESLQQPRVAVVYDHLTTNKGGAELVLQLLLKTFPGAPLFTTVFDPKLAPWAKVYEVKPSFLQKLGRIKKLHMVFAPLHTLAVESLDFSPFDVVISVSGGAAKGIHTSPKQLHVSYILTPTRYLFAKQQQKHDYLSSHPVFKIPGIEIITTPIFHYLKKWDRAAAWRPDKIIAISQLVADRIKEKYHRDADAIIYPPFEITSAQKEDLGKYFLSLGRLVSYKKIDVAIQACLNTQHVLAIAGMGGEFSRLISQAGGHSYLRNKNQSITDSFTQAKKLHKLIIFLGSCSEAEKATLLASAEALLMPGEEDFGLTGLEAAAHGTPTITYFKSGIAEILTEPDSALHVQDHTVESLSKAIQQFDKSSFSVKTLQQKVKPFSADQFQKQFRNTIYQFWQQHSTI